MGKAMEKIMGMLLNGNGKVAGDHALRLGLPYKWLYKWVMSGVRVGNKMDDGQRIENAYGFSK